MAPTVSATHTKRNPGTAADRVHDQVGIGEHATDRHPPDRVGDQRDRRRRETAQGEDQRKADEQAFVMVSEPSGDLVGVVSWLWRGLDPCDDKEHDGIQVVKGDRGEPRQPEFTLWVVEPGGALHAVTLATVRSRGIDPPRTTAMTAIQMAIAMFLTQNDRNPFQANGPVRVRPANPAGTSATAMSRLK